jgi:hypothetical protein
LRAIGIVIANDWKQAIDATFGRMLAFARILANLLKPVLGEKASGSRRLWRPCAPGAR